LTLQKLHEIVGGRLRLATLAPSHGEATPMQRIVTDSRQVRVGDVFWGLRGTRFDGANFAVEAYSRGAVGTVVGKYVQPWPHCFSLQVHDSQLALHSLARWNRQRMAGQVVAVTGSVGKTTTRQMIRSVLATRFCGSASPRNFNNQIGLPLSMLAIEPEHDFAVLELAASGPGEILQLASLCRPQIGVITKIGDAHLRGFGSVHGVAEAKTELLPVLPADGWAVLGGDDPRLRKLASRARTNIVWFGRSLDNDLVATNIRSRGGRLSFSVDGTSMSVGVWGRHHLSGALAAVAVGRIFGICDAEIAHGLAQFQPPPMRCQITKLDGATIIDDTYNASPVAMRAALELLRDFDAHGRRIVVCGDMGELGDEAESLHYNLGDQVVTLCGADRLVAFGSHAEEVVAGARAAGMPRDHGTACHERQELIEICRSLMQSGDVVLVKGSRQMAMEQLVEALRQQPRSCAA
ncbi:MAG TPA: UDP-N-acetylmuramoyl-tripeptide--D-alanyl-D-alanine ligase, partial [Pirellulales bacterium]|nr:UDP-N-acetylmuramoyl-tripeptide--D-alanyl-D-alanine ligase [Pirellulales bacterium]